MQRGRPARCPFCGGYRSSLKGRRLNKSGPVRIRKCKQCRRRWTPKAKQYRAGKVGLTTASVNAG